MIGNQENRIQKITKQDQKYTHEPKESRQESRQRRSTGGVFVILYFLMGGDRESGWADVIMVEFNDDFSLRGDEGPWLCRKVNCCCQWKTEGK